MNILIADDNPTILKMLRAVLEAEGHRVWGAADGEEALKVLEHEDIQAVISDILMPHMDGYRLCLEVRKSKTFGDVPFIFYTSTYTSPSDEKTAMSLGADKFLKKPAPSAQIFQALQEALEQPARNKPNAVLPSEELGLMKEYNARLVSKLQKRNLDLEHSEAESRQSREQLRALAARLQSAREEERIRISREIHDDLGGLLTGFKFGLARIRDQLQEQDRPEIRHQLEEQIASMGSLADSTSSRIRELCTDLRPSVLDNLGLVAAIEWQTREFQKRTNIRCETSLEEQHVATEQATALFRIFQEILTNVARHSQASKIRVLLKAEGANLVLEVKDNGIGIQPEQVAGTGSLGLLGMRERAAVLGGTVDIEGQKRRGTTVRVVAPIGRSEPVMKAESSHFS
jgi:signal transduction histidine kinase